MPSTVDVKVHPQAIDDVLRSSGMRDTLEAYSRPIVADAKQRAPKDTGRGAASLDSAMVLTDGEWESLISWDQLHYYMYFSERPTKQRPAQPFLVPALRAAQR